MFQVVGISCSGEGVGVAGAGSVEADRHRIRGDAEDFGDLLVAEFFPGDKAQQLLIRGRQRGQGDEGGSVVVVAGAEGGRDVLHAQECRQSLATTVATAMVGEDAPGDGIEPREWLLGRDGVELAPGDREGLGGHVLGIGEGPGATHRVGEDGTLVLGEDRVEASELGTSGHGPGTDRSVARFPGNGRFCRAASSIE